MKMFKCCGRAVRRMEKSHLYGISLAFVSGLFLALGGLFSNFLTGNRSQAVLVQFILTFWGSLPVLTYRKEDILFTQRTIAVYVIGFCICSSVGTLTFYLAMKHLPMGDVFAIYNAFVVTTQLLSCVFLKEKCQVSDIIFTLISLVGVVCVAQPDFIFPEVTHGSHHHDVSQRLTGVVLAVSANLSTAGTILFSRAIGHQVSSTFTMFYRGFLGSIFVSICMGFVAHAYDMPCLEDCGYLCLSALCGYVSLLVRTMALQVERAGPVSVAYTGQIGFAFLFDYFFLNCTVNFISVIGAVAIFISAIGTILRSFFLNLSISKKQKPHNSM